MAFLVVKMTKDKRYILEYVDRTNYDPALQVLTEVEVVVPPETLAAMFQPNEQPFYRFLIRDGEDFIISVDYVHSLTQIF